MSSHSLTRGRVHQLSHLRRAICCGPLCRQDAWLAGRAVLRRPSCWSPNSRSNDGTVFEWVERHDSDWIRQPESSDVHRTPRHPRDRSRSSFVSHALYERSLWIFVRCERHRHLPAPLSVLPGRRSWPAVLAADTVSARQVNRKPGNVCTPGVSTGVLTNGDIGAIEQASATGARADADAAQLVIEC